jgi:predicted TIM-barrel fold metal-dependent hydrolase
MALASGKTNDTIKGMVRNGARLGWLALAVCWAQPQETVKYGVKVQPGPMDTVLLKDYRPESSLVVPETRVDKARFPVIDVHTHTFMSNIRTPADVDEWVRTMDEVGVEKSIVFTGAIGDEFARQVELYLERYPHRFQLWCAIDTRDIDAPDYPERVVRELERCYRLGARGVGELTDKGSGLQDEARPPGKRLHLDDSRLDPLWRKCAELKLPVNLHVADHPSCWRPLGPTQERTPDFQHFNLYGKDVLSYEELLARRDRLLARHPQTTFILCHLSNQGNDLASLARALDRFPNLYVDISARDYELGRQPRFARRFLESYSDRVLFGTDMGRETHMYRMWWRLLETPDEYMPGRIWWRYYGLELSPQALEKLYRGNALRILNWN